jgi:hypothetical protein
MASFDFRIPVPANERGLARLLLKYLQRLVAERRCTRRTELYFRWCEPSHEVPYRSYLVAVAGDFTELQAFAFDAITALYHFGEGVIATERAKRRTTQIHRVIPIAFVKAVYEFNEDFVDLTRQLHNTGISIVPNTYIFGRVKDESVNWLLLGLTSALTAWRNDKSFAEPVVEQLHTTIEGLMRKLFNERGSRKTFKQMVGIAFSGGIITAEEYDSVLRFNVLRRNAKHRRQRVSIRKLEAELNNAVSLCHKLVSRLPAMPWDNKSLKRSTASAACRPTAL